MFWLKSPSPIPAPKARDFVKLLTSAAFVLQVGHVERFNPALESRRIQTQRPLFIECHRLAPFKVRSTEVDVVLDLMIHDLDVILSLVKSTAKSRFRPSGRPC